jgi:hypothetical protein
MALKTEDLERYKVAIEHVRYEGQLLWQIFGSFLLTHTIFMAFLLQAATGNAQIIPSYRLGMFIASIAGMVLCIPWAGSYARSSAFYIFRMAQARQVEPKDWTLVGKDGENFSSGNIVILGAEQYQIFWLARIFRTQRSVPFLIFFFFLIYLAFFILSGPWWVRCIK